MAMAASPGPYARGPSAAPDMSALLAHCLRAGWPLPRRLVPAVVPAAAAVSVLGFLAWPIFALVLGASCGAASGGGRLAVAPRQSWIVCVAFWLTLAIVLAGAVHGAALTGGEFVRLLFADTTTTPTDDGRGLRAFDVSVVLGSGGWLTWLAWPTFGFAVGHVCALRWSVRAAGMVAVPLALLAGLLWAPTALLGELRPWYLLLPTGFLLVGGFMAVREATGARPGVPCLAALLCVLAGPAWRAWEIPDVDEPLAAVPLPSVGSDRATGRVDAVLRRMEATVLRECAALAEPLPRPGRAAKSLPPSQNPLIALHEWCNQVRQFGWVGVDRGFETWLDRVFAEQWHAEWTEALRLPLDESAAGPAPRELQDSSRFLLLVAARVPQLQARGADSAALQEVLSLLSLSRLLRHHAGLDHTILGHEVETKALDILDGWMARAARSRALLRQALVELRRHDEAVPTDEDVFSIETIRRRDIVDEPPPTPLLQSAWVNPDTAATRQRKFLRTLAVRAPWERERRRRLLATLYTGLARGAASAIQAPTATPPRIPGWLPAPEAGRRLDEADLIRHLDASGMRDLRQRAEQSDPLNLWRPRSAASRRASLLKLALVLHQAEHVRPPARLADLSPRYLAELPADPFSGGPFGYRVVPSHPWRTLSWALLERLPLPLSVPLLGEQVPVWWRGSVRVAPGQALLWSAGPNGVDDGGAMGGDRRDFGRLDGWFEKRLDWLMPVPWPGM